MPAMVGTASMDWMLRTVGLGVDAIEPALAASPPGANGVEVLPYFATSGERAPFVDPHASGQVTGVRLTTTRDDLVRAVFEGLAYAARHCFEVAGHSGRVVACGGGTGSRGWLQVFADVLGTPVQLARTPEVGARGAVLAALQSRGDEVDAATWTAPQAEVEPDPGRGPATTTVPALPRAPPGGTAALGHPRSLGGSGAVGRAHRGDRLPVSAGDPAAARTAVVQRVPRAGAAGTGRRHRRQRVGAQPATCWPCSPSGVDYDRMAPDDVGLHDLDREAGRRPAAARPASWRCTWSRTRRPLPGGDGCAVVHTHAVASTALSTVADGYPWAPPTTTARCSEDRCR